MAETSLPPATATPKRKRDDRIAEMRPRSPTTPRHAKSVFSFQPPNLQPIIRSDDMTEDGSRSPRSRVVQRFKDLAIGEGGEREGEGPSANTATGSAPESGGGAAADARTLHWIGNEKLAAPAATRFDFDAGTAATQEDMELDPDDDDGATARKRARTLELDIINPGSTTNSSLGEISDLPAQTISADDETCDQQSVSIDPSIICTVEASESADFPKSIPSISRLADSKSRGRRRRRVGTPPRSRRKRNAQSQSVKEDEEEEPIIVDPVRAALTWREDEITIYDPNDKDDDGEGVNGVGFKPTTAIAYDRVQKRRRQVAEYKKREASEARTRRSQRRRDKLASRAEMARKHSLVRVQFSEAPPTLFQLPL